MPRPGRPAVDGPARGRTSCHASAMAGRRVRAVNRTTAAVHGATSIPMVSPASAARRRPRQAHVGEADGGGNERMRGARARRATGGGIGNCGGSRPERCEAPVSAGTGSTGAPRGVRDPLGISHRRLPVLVPRQARKRPPAPHSLRISRSERKRQLGTPAGSVLPWSGPSAQPLCREMFRSSPSRGPRFAALPAPGSRCWLALGCRPAPAGGPAVVTFPGSVLGAEGQVLRRQLARFARLRPDIRVVQRPTPDAADQRHQLYVQWLNARASEPDILQLDVVWTPEFAAAGWILDLDRFRPPTDSFFPATIAANQWQGRLYAVPWFVDVGMLYWRTDLMATAARHLRRARAGRGAGAGGARPAVRPGVAGRPLRGAGDGVQRVPRRLRRRASSTAGG